jgi:hypothetical protein
MSVKTPAVATATVGPNIKCIAAYDQVVAAPQLMFSQISMEGNLTAIVITQHQIMAGLKTAAMQTIVSRSSLKGVYGLVIKT